jgi:hypothetical protein
MRPTPDALALDTPTDAPLSGKWQRLRDQLPARDLAVLRSLAALGLMTTGHVQRLHFYEGSDLTQARRARRSLERLHARQLVTRLERRIGGDRAGSAGHVYRAATTGRRLLGLPGVLGGRNRRLAEPSPHKTGHVLAVTELAVTLHEAHRAGQLDLVRFETEPASWREWTGPAGDTRHVRPDAFAVVARGDWEHLWFLEADMGTERPARLRAKAAVYRTYAATGQEQERWGTFPLVAYLTTTPGRAESIADHIGPDPFAVVALFADDVPQLLSSAGASP